GAVRFSDAMELAGCSDPAVQLVLRLFTIQVPYAQRLDCLAGEEIAADCHADGIENAERGFGAAASADGGADGSADVVPAEQELPPRDGRGIRPRIGHGPQSCSIGAAALAAQSLFLLTAQFLDLGDLGTVVTVFFGRHRCVPCRRERRG